MKVISSEKHPIKLWLDDIEDGAMEQAKNLANLPFIFKHVAIMPDSHQGYGMPIGGVIATKDVIIPNAVGVDIGAVDKETEVLTENGWIKIDQYSGQNVLVWDDYKQTTFFSKPLLYIVKPCEDFTEYKSKYGMDQLLSDEHRMLVYHGYGQDKKKKSQTYFCHDFREMLLNKKKTDYYSIRTTFPTSEKGIDMTDDQIRIKIMVSADGCVRHESMDRTSVELHFKKNRKIVRSKELLESSGVEYKEYKHKDNTLTISFDLDWRCTKDLRDLFLCNQHQAEIIFDEYLNWDGAVDKKRNHKSYSSTDKNNADVIQYICALNGVRAGIGRCSHENKNWNDWYNVYQTGNPYVGFGKPKKIKIKEGKKYCFVVETGYFIARRNNKIFITGNCGMCAVKTSLTDIDTDTLKNIMGEIRKQIPVGFSHQKEAQDERFMPLAPDGETPIVKKEYTNAITQIGTLGGGNHFIEIQKGSDGHIWIMIHSGSRNIGFTVANYYNKLAIELNDKWKTVVPKEWELAFLPIDSEEGKAYIREMNYCVEFALANRKLMMERIMEIFSSKTSATELDFINIAHNYASLENHFGSNVMVHRKGATLARENTIGIIPGSQGTHSYIVQGKGSPESFMSCSHGAGRLMSRTKAENELNLEEEIKRLDEQGIIHSIRNKKDLDEAPSAYKNIDTVMENQKDLVEILVELTPLGVIKG